MFDKQFNKTRIVCKNINRPLLNLCEYTLVKVLDLKSHSQMLANT